MNILFLIIFIIFCLIVFGADILYFYILWDARRKYRQIIYEEEENE